MVARSVQISVDDVLLAQVDELPQVKEKGRSAFIREAIAAYLELLRTRGIDGAYQRAYGGRAEEVWEDLGELMSGQAWSKDE